MLYTSGRVRSLIVFLYSREHGRWLNHGEHGAHGGEQYSYCERQHPLSHWRRQDKCNECQQFSPSTLYSPVFPVSPVVNLSDFFLTHAAFGDGIL